MLLSGFSFQGIEYIMTLTPLCIYPYRRRVPWMGVFQIESPGRLAYISPSVFEKRLHLIRPSRSYTSIVVSADL